MRSAVRSFAPPRWRPEKGLPARLHLSDCRSRPTPASSMLCTPPHPPPLTHPSTHTPPAHPPAHPHAHKHLHHRAPLAAYARPRNVCHLARMPRSFCTMLAFLRGEARRYEWEGRRPRTIRRRRGGGAAALRGGEVVDRATPLHSSSGDRSSGPGLAYPRPPLAWPCASPRPGLALPCSLSSLGGSCPERLSGAKRGQGVSSRAEGARRPMYMYKGARRPRGRAGRSRSR